VTARALARSATGRLRDQAAELIRAGRDIVDMTAGELADPTPEHIVEAATRAARNPELHHYGRIAGDPELRSAVATWATARVGRPIEVEHVLVTNGAKQALFNALAALLEPGEEVIVAAPTWPTFPAAVRLAGGSPVVAPLDPELLLSGARAFEAVRTETTRAVIVTSPHNPSGLTYSPAEVRRIAAWADEHGLWVIADDTYVELAFTETAPWGAERLVTIGSTSKSHAMSGWRTGWLIAPSEVIDRAIAVQSHTTSNVNRVAQAAAAAALTGPDVVTPVRRRLERQRDRVLARLEPLGSVGPRPGGGFFVFPAVAGDDVALAERLIAEAGVATVPGSAFGCPGHLRISYGGPPDRVDEGVGRIVAALAAS
jgi:aspartate aminotransferase